MAFSKDAVITHPGSHRRSQKNIQSTEASLAKVSINNSIRKRLGNARLWDSWSSKVETTVNQENISAHLTFAKKHLEDEAFWRNVLWKEESKVDNTGSIMSSVKKIQHFTARTSYQNMVV